MFSEPLDVISAVAPTNHCDATGALQGTAPAHTPVRTCHATGVITPASITADCAATAKRLMPTSEVCIDEVPVLRTSVFGLVKEIAVDRPAVLGGHTDAGYEELNLLVETVKLSMLLRKSTVAVAIARINMRWFFMQSPHLQFHFCDDLKEGLEQLW
jgi:hypothetical protein